MRIPRGPGVDPQSKVMVYRQTQIIRGPPIDERESAARGRVPRVRRNHIESGLEPCLKRVIHDEAGGDSEQKSRCMPPMRSSRPTADPLEPHSSHFRSHIARVPPAGGRLRNPCIIRTTRAGRAQATLQAPRLAFDVSRLSGLKDF